MDEAERMILDARLQNWGRWSRETPKQGTSPLWSILETMRMLNARDDESARHEPDDKLPQPDPKDAAEIEAAILRMPVDTLTDARARELMIALYLHPAGHVGRVLHALRIRRRAMEPMMRRAFDLLGRSLKAPRRSASVRLPAAPRHP